MLIGGENGTVGIGKPVGEQKADVVPGLLILRTGIAQTSDKIVIAVHIGTK